ncbi:MAG: PilZ domain-containing protein [Polyangiaceae bacterium]|nr:PilZ domain-containing protein [Polyangiaceae bacterium]
MSAGRDSDRPPGARGALAETQSEVARGRESQPPGSEKRSAERVDVMWAVDCETDDNFLFASITNISALGIFVQTTEPLPVGRLLALRFAPHGENLPFVLRGRVQWVNEVKPLGDNLNPGMGIMFVDLTPEQRERLVEVVKTIAYLRTDPSSDPTATN